MIKIESRPDRRSLGRYVFLIDMEGHREDPLVRDALSEVESRDLNVQNPGFVPQSPALGLSRPTSFEEQGEHKRRCYDQHSRYPFDAFHTGSSLWNLACNPWSQAGLCRSEGSADTPHCHAYYIFNFVPC